jgi:hypothetical protein
MKIGDSLSSSALTAHPILPLAAIYAILIRYSDIKERTGKESTKREPPERQALLSQRGKTGGERDISIE